MTSALRVERTGTRTGVAQNGRGASLRFGPGDVEGSFTPGELLALALAACNLMSADHAVVRRLGDQVHVAGTVTPVKDTGENTYVGASVDLTVEGADGLDDDAWLELVAVASRAIERGCTVGRTLDAGMPHTLAITKAGAQPSHGQQEAR